MFRLSVIFDPGAGPYAWIDVKKGEITLHPDILEVEGAVDLRKSLAWLANIAPLVGATDIVCEIDTTLTSSPAVLDVTFIKTETTGMSKETEMSATVKIMQKKKAEAEAKAAEAPAEEAATEAPASDDTAAEDPPLSSDAPEEEGTIEGDLPKAEDPPEPKADPKPKASTSTKPKPAKTEEATDLIVVTSNEIENLSEDKAVTKLKDLIDNQSFDAFRIGGILAKIQTEGWIGEHQNFRSFVESEFDIKYRTAMMWIALYGDVLSSGVSWDKVKGLGWTKVAILAPILNTDNVDSVLTAVYGMSVVAVRAYADQFDAAPGAKAAESAPAEVETLKTKSFKLFAGQKETVDLAIEKAKKATSSDSDSHALEMICTDYMASSKKAPAPSIPTGALLFDPKAPLDFDLVAAFTAIRDESADLPEALNHILTALNEVAPKANIAVEIED